MVICNDKKEAVNARTVSLALDKEKKKLVNVEMTLTGIQTFEKPDEKTGEIKKVTILHTKEHGAISTTSPTVRDCIDGIIDAFEESEILEGMKVKFITSESKNNRDFYQLVLV